MQSWLLFQVIAFLYVETILGNSLFIRYLLFTICYSLFVIAICYLLIGYYSLFIICYLIFDILLFDIRYLLFAICCSFFVISLFAVRGLIVLQILNGRYA